jgi:hypothetical protein
MGPSSPPADVCAFTCAVERSRSPPHMCCCRYNELLPASILGGGDCGPCCSMACCLLAHCAFTSVVRVQVTQGAPGCYLPAPLVLGGWVERLTLLTLLTGPAGPCWAAALPAHRTHRLPARRSPAHRWVVRGLRLVCMHPLGRACADRSSGCLLYSC